MSGMGGKRTFSNGDIRRFAMPSGLTPMLVRAWLRPVQLHAASLLRSTTMTAFASTPATRPRQRGGYSQR